MGFVAKNYCLSRDLFLLSTQGPALPALVCANFSAQSSVYMNSLTLVGFSRGFHHAEGFQARPLGLRIKPGKIRAERVAPRLDPAVVLLHGHVDRQPPSATCSPAKVGNAVSAQAPNAAAKALWLILPSTSLSVSCDGMPPGNTRNPRSYASFSHDHDDGRSKELHRCVVTQSGSPAFFSSRYPHGARDALP